MTEEFRSVERMFWQLGQQVFERVVRGEHDYEKDMKALKIYLERAERLESLPLQARMWSIMAILNNVSGRVPEAEANLKKALSLLEDTHYLESRLTVMYNLGYVYFRNGDFEKTLQIYNDAIAQIDNPQDMLSMSFTLYTGKMSLLVATQRYEEAEQETENFNPLAEAYLNSSRQDFARRMMYVYLNLARISLNKKELEQANSHAKMGLELASQMRLPAEVAELYLTCARVAWAMDDTTQADDYLQQAETQVDQMQMPVDKAYYYLSGARFLLEDGDTERAKSYAEKAHSHYQALNVEVGSRVAQYFLDKTQEKPTDSV